MSTHRNRNREGQPSARGSLAATLIILSSFGIVAGGPSALRAADLAAQNFEYRDLDPEQTVSETVAAASSNVIHISGGKRAILGDGETFVSTEKGNEATGNRTILGFDKRARTMSLAASVRFITASNQQAEKAYNTKYLLPDDSPLLEITEGDPVAVSDFEAALNDPETTFDSITVTTSLDYSDGTGTADIQQIRRDETGQLIVDPSARSLEVSPGQYGYKPAIEQVTQTVDLIAQQAHDVNVR